MVLELTAPAKLNLYLKVLFRRPDGYHELRTLFQTVELADRLVLEPREDGRILLECDRPGIPTDGTNLCVRAAEALKEATGTTSGVRIRLYKNIPDQAGLGGGSSDAAATLAGLDRLWKTGVGREALAELGRGLGADVPFFLAGGTALGIGRGDEIVPLPDLPPFPVVLTFPGVVVSTPWAYGQLNLLLTNSDATTNIPRLRGFSPDSDTLLQMAENDFETVVFKEYPELSRIKDQLRAAGACPALMSGSGSSVYGVFRSEAQSRQAAGLLESGLGPGRVVVTRFLPSGATGTPRSAAVVH